MVSVWIFVWLFLSGALLYFLAWTLFILFRQKSAWKTFAEQRKLRYSAPSLMASPAMEGMIDGYSLSYFVGEHMMGEARSSRKLTAIEIKLLSKIPFEGVVASGGMVSLARDLRMKEEFSPEHPKWDKNYIALSSSKGAIGLYLTSERLDAITSLMKIRNGWVVLVFRGDVMLLRFDTPDALESQEKLKKITQKMIDTAKVLELKAGEQGVLKSEAARAPVKAVNVAIRDKDFDDAKAFQLEDEQVVVKPQSNEDDVKN